MADPISIIFGALSFAKSAGELVGLIESTDAKLDKLIESEFATGFDLIFQAKNSSGRRGPLLEQAIPVLTKAKNLESGYRKALSLVGLAFCHHHLGDLKNSTEMLWEIRNVEISPRKENVARAKDAALAVSGVMSVASVIIIGSTGKYGDLVKEEKLRLGRLKESLESYLESTF